MTPALVIICYLILRIFFNLASKKGSELTYTQFIIAFLVFSFTVFLVFAETEILFELLTREFSADFSAIYAVGSFIFGYELSWRVFKKFSQRETLQKIQLKSFLNFFYCSVFSLIYLIFSTFLLMFVV